MSISLLIRLSVNYMKNLLENKGNMKIDVMISFIYFTLKNKT
jgi:hypothetical protein